MAGSIQRIFGSEQLFPLQDMSHNPVWRAVRLLQIVTDCDRLFLRFLPTSSVEASVVVVVVAGGVGTRGGDISYATSVGISSDLKEHAERAYVVRYRAVILRQGCEQAYRNGEW